MMCPVTLPASWVASTNCIKDARCKDAGSVHSSSLDATEDAAARRVIAGQAAGERCRGASLHLGPRLEARPTVVRRRLGGDERLRGGGEAVVGRVLDGRRALGVGRLR